MTTLQRKAVTRRPTASSARAAAFRTGLLLSTVVAGGLLGIAAPAAAQTASQVTPPAFRPGVPPASPGTGLVIPDSAGLEAPAEMAGLKVVVGGVQVEGGLPELAEAERALQASLTGREVTAAEIFAAARALEADYARQGYVLVRIVLPPQTIENGAPLRLWVLNGWIERIDASAVPPAVRGRVEAVLRRLGGRPGVTLAEVERALLLAGETPGVALRSALRPGATSGASVLVVEGRFKPVTGSYSADNTPGAPLGGRYMSVGLDINSPTGNGEVIYLRAGGDFRRGPEGADRDFLAEQPRNRSVVAGVAVPLGDDGLMLSFEGVDARTTPRTRPGDLEITSRFQRLSARLRYPVIRSRAFSLGGDLSFDAQDELVQAISPVEADLSHDTLRVLRAGVDLTLLAPGDALIGARLTASGGIDGLGARAAPTDPNATPLSRQGAAPDFRKLELGFSLSRPLVRQLTLDLRGRAQTAFEEALPSSEQIGLAGADGLSAFDAGGLQGDSGYVVRGELRFPVMTGFTLPFALPDIPAQQGAGLPAGGTTAGALLVSPYVFGAIGETRLHRPTVIEQASTRGSAWGVGVRVGAAARSRFASLSGSLEYGRGRLDRPGPDRDEDRLTASLSFAF